MKCSHAKEILVPIDEDIYNNGNTHQCIGEGSGHCWRYGKIVDGVFVPDSGYEDQDTLLPRTLGKGE